MLAERGGELGAAVCATARADAGSSAVEPSGLLHLEFRSDED